MSSRKIGITAADGQTGLLVAELLLTTPFSSKYSTLSLFALDPSKCESLKDTAGDKVHVLPLTTDPKKLLESLKSEGCDTMFIIPPASKDKFKIVEEVVSAAGKLKSVQNVVLLSSAGCDVAERDKQPGLRQFIDMEALVMNAKGETAMGSTGHSPCIIRAGFYAENLLLYEPQAKSGELPLPAGKKGKFAPVSLGDIAQLAATILTGEGEHGLDDRHRGQLIICTGPAMMAGEELAEAASQALGSKMTYKAISEAEAKKILAKQSDLDESEKQYLLEYYSLVRENKTNYVSTLGFQQICGTKLQEATEFFKVYKDSFDPKGAKSPKQGTPKSPGSPNKRYKLFVRGINGSRKTSK